MEKEDFQETLNELSECREDERNAQNQILQIFTAAAAALTLILGTSIFKTNDIDKNISFYLYILSNIILYATSFYTVSIGVTGVLRFHYIQSLEDKLFPLQPKDEPNIIHWMSFSSAVNTKNIKHIFNSRYTCILYIFYSIATILAISFCVGLIVVENIVFGLNKLYLIIPLFLLFTTFSAYIFMSVKAKDMYKFCYVFSSKKQKERLSLLMSDVQDNTTGNNIFTKALLYFIYPKAKDFQKIFFVLGGYCLGILLVNNPVNYLSVFCANIKAMCFVVVIIEILVYQARYQFNDIRGLEEDLLLKKTDKLLTLSPNINKSIILSMIILFIKIVLALVLTLNFGGEMTAPLLWCISLITITTILYEIARTKKYDKAVLILVTLGYPLRLLAGLWCAIPTLFETGIQFRGLNISSVHIILYLLSFAALGGFSVAIAWIYEAFYQKQTGKIIKKHYQYLFNKFEDRYNKYIKHDKTGKYPLMEQGKILDWWNFYFLISIVLISINIVSLTSYNIWLICFECIGIILTAVLCVCRYRGIKAMIILTVIFIALKAVYLLLCGSLVYKYIYLGLYAHQLIFSFIYWWLRCKFDPSFNFFKSLFALFVGPDTLKLIKKKQ